MRLPSPPARAAPARVTDQAALLGRMASAKPAGGSRHQNRRHSSGGRVDGGGPCALSIVRAVVALRRRAARPGAGLIAGYSGHLWKMLLITGSLCCLDDTTDPRGTKPSVVRYARRQHFVPPSASATARWCGLAAARGVTAQPGTEAGGWGWLPWLSRMRPRRPTLARATSAALGNAKWPCA